MYYKLKEYGLTDKTVETVGLEFLDLDKIIAKSNSHRSSVYTSPVISHVSHRTSRSSKSNLQLESNDSGSLESVREESPESNDNLLERVRADFIR